MIAQPIALAENTIGRQPLNGGNGDGFTVGGPMYTLNATGVHGVAQPLAFAQNTRDEVRLINGDGQIVGALAASPGMKQTSYVAVAYAFDSLSSNSMKSSNPDSGVNQVDVSKTLDTSRGLDPSCNQGGIGVVQSVSACDVADTLTVDANQTTGFIGDVVAQPIGFEANMSQSSVSVGDVYHTLTRRTHASILEQTNMAVRRLTPIECEALQGFPKNYTNIPWRKKEDSPDGPRYKALGNSMAVPVMAWIGQRIQLAEDIHTNLKL
jgi:DNA (cytosine-5)-methyltransferase 1